MKSREDRSIVVDSITAECAAARSTKGAWVCQGQGHYFSEAVGEESATELIQRDERGDRGFPSASEWRRIDVRGATELRT
jgi:hypothetical protein